MTEPKKRLTVEEKLGVCFSAVLDFLKYSSEIKDQKFEDEEGTRPHLMSQVQCVQQSLRRENGEFG